MENGNYRDHRGYMGGYMGGYIGIMERKWKLLGLGFRVWEF